jgi:hypothetical protein
MEVDLVKRQAVAYRLFLFSPKIVLPESIIFATCTKQSLKY